MSSSRTTQQTKAAALGAVAAARDAAAAQGLTAADLRARLAPLVEHAVDAARDRLVDDVLPRLVEAVHSATAAGVAASSAAGDTVSHAVEDAARSLADSTPSAKARRRRTRTRRRVLWISLFAALGAAAAAVAARRQQRAAASWELAPTPTGTVPPPAASSSTTPMDVIASAAGPSDAGLAVPPAGTPAADSKTAETTPGGVPIGTPEDPEAVPPLDLTAGLATDESGAEEPATSTDDTPSGSGRRRA